MKDIKEGYVIHEEKDLNLATFISAHINKSPEAMNAEFSKFARKSGLSLNVQNNDPWGIAPLEAQRQAVEVNEAFTQTLDLFSAVMVPSIEEIDNMLNDEIETVEIQIVTSEKTYKGTVFLGILGKLLSLWIDTNELVEIEPGEASQLSSAPVISESELRLFHGALSTVNYSFLHYRDDSSFSRMQEDLSYFLEQLENYEGEYSKTIKSIIAGELENIINSGLYEEESENVDEDLIKFSEELMRTIEYITNAKMERVYGLYMEVAKSIIADKG